METMKVVAFAKIANTIRKASIVINANRNSIDLMGANGTTPMFANVNLNDIQLLLLISNRVHINIHSQLVIVTISFRPAIARRKRAVANVDLNIRSPIVSRARTVTSVFPSVVRANAI